MAVVRFVDDNWHLQQQVVTLMLLAKSLKGEEVTWVLIMSLSNQFADQLVATMRIVLVLTMWPFKLYGLCTHIFWMWVAFPTPLITLERKYRQT